MDGGPRQATLYVFTELDMTEWLTGEGNGTPLQYSCLENPMDGGAWWAAVHGVAKNRTRLSKFTFTFHIHALEKEMATHSSVLAWRIPGTGEPGGLPSMGPDSQTRLKRLSSSSSSSSRATNIFIFTFHSWECSYLDDKAYGLFNYGLSTVLGNEDATVSKTTPHIMELTA